MPIPTDEILYDSVKKYIYKKYPAHSAYRSGLLVKEYKRQFSEMYGGEFSPYIGKRNSRQGLSRWFAEEWRNQRGQVGYQKRGDVYRPTRRITRRTPATLSELSREEIERARREKASRGRVGRFKL
jgi:hypothetical protein